jgi:class 3 adenylate cyclase
MKALSEMTPDALLEMALDVPEAGIELERRYMADVAILVVDFSSMRARTDAFGIVHTLATVRAAFRAYSPAIAEAGGEQVKTVADTIFAVFDAPADALRAALEGHVRMAEFNASRKGSICEGIPNAPIIPSTGLGYGPALVFPGENLFGAEVNRAFILGEDVARSGEILASADFVSGVGIPPSGVGLHAAPHDRVEESGFPFQIYTDFRDR